MCEESFVFALYGFGAVRQTGDIFERGGGGGGWGRERRDILSHLSPLLAAYLHLLANTGCKLGAQCLTARTQTRRLRFQLLYRAALKAASITAE